MTLALSWSRWSDFAQCARKFHLKYLAKAKNFQIDDKNKSQHLVRGQNLHEQLENYTLWKIDQLEARRLGRPFEKVEPPMTPETAALKPAIDMLFATSEFVLPETQMAVNKDWQRVDWFAKDAMFRAIMDTIAGRSNHAILWDYKSGKYQPYLSDPDDPGQLHLSAAMAIKMKGYDFVDVSYLFIDEKKPEGIRVTQEHVPKIIKIWDERLAKVNSEVTWAPRRNDNCVWCEATPEQCEFAKPKRPQSRSF